MRVLIVLGSPRKGGNSETLANRVAEGVIEEGGEVEYVRLNEMHLQPCQGCGACDKTGICIINDDMPGIYDKCDKADRIVLASPIYFYGLTAQAKIFGDRMQAQWSRRYLLKKRYRLSDERKGYLISTAATQGKKLFDAAILTTRYIFDAMDVQYGGELVVRSVEKRKDLMALGGELERALEFGRSIACLEI